MKLSAINKLKDLHNKVIHATDHINGYTDEEYLAEDKKLKKLSSPVLEMICSKCFPNTWQYQEQEAVKFKPRESYQYDIRYPKVTKIVWEYEI